MVTGEKAFFKCLSRSSGGDYLANWGVGQFLTGQKTLKNQQRELCSSCFGVVGVVFDR